MYLIYPNVQFETYAMYRKTDVAPPSPFYLESTQIEDLSSDVEGVSQPDTDFKTSAESKLFLQSKINDLTLPKDVAELLGPRLLSEEKYACPW